MTPDIEPVRVVYEAEAGCPGRSKFVEELMARTPKVAIVEAAGAKRTFVVTVRASGSGFVGRLEIQTGDPGVTTRELTGPSCPAVVSAVALVAALAVDPDSLRGDAPAKEGAPREDTHPPSPNIAQPAAVPAVSTAPPAASPSLQKERTWRWAVGAKGEANSFIAPRVSFGGGAFVELGSSDDDAHATPIQGSVGIEAVRLAAHFALTGTVQQNLGTAHFDWAALSLEGCPARVRWGGARLDACASFSGGLLRGHGDSLTVPQSSFQPENPPLPWWSVAPLVRVKWTFFRSWFLEAEGSLTIPLRRDRFVFQQPTEPTVQPFYEVPTVGAAAGLGIGYRFDDRQSDRRP